MSKTKRSCVPKCIKRMSSGPTRGLKIGPFLLVQTIVMPLLLVGSDMVSDGGVLGQMWPYTALAKLLAGADSGNSTGEANISRSDEAPLNEERNTGITNSTAREQEDDSEAVDVEGLILFILFLVSILILFYSTLNLLWSNPLATLMRSARTTVMMNSRELERKDVPVPLGNN